MVTGGPGPQSMQNSPNDSEVIVLEIVGTESYSPRAEL